MSKDKGMLSRLSLVPAGLRSKLMIVFSLMSVIPLMICVYIATNFIFPYIGMANSLGLVIAITIFIAILGFIVAKKMIEPIIEIAIEAKIIAGGDFERSIEIKEEGEARDLAMSLNSMSDTIKDNLRELKSYGEKTREINVEIHKKVMVLSALLQIGNLISAGTDLKSVLDILVEKMSLLDNGNSAGIMLIDSDRENMIPFSAMNIDNAEAAKLPISLKRGLFARLRTEMQDIIIDKNLNREDEAVTSFKDLYAFKNCVIVPIVVCGRLEGIIFLGNSEDDFEYNKDDMELLHVFCKQAAIAVENDALIKKTEELEIKDELTQLYNVKFIKEYLEEEIKRGMIYQRPCAFILLNVDDFKLFCEKHGRMAGESALKTIAKLIKSELSPVDKAGRFGDNEFALVLPERNKKEAKNIADEMRQKIAELNILSSATGGATFLTVSVSLTENPIDGISGKELTDKAKSLLKQAKEEGKNIVKA
jgi:diguanylate cyclase (GGDEF)-like protein